MLPAQAFAKITCRLVANQKPDFIFARLRTRIEAYCPKGLSVIVERLAGSADPFLVPPGHKYGYSRGFNGGLLQGSIYNPHRRIYPSNGHVAE
jgi:hypothetical protein